MRSSSLRQAATIGVAGIGYARLSVLLALGAGVLACSSPGIDETDSGALATDASPIDARVVASDGGLEDGSVDASGPAVDAASGPTDGATSDAPSDLDAVVVPADAGPACPSSSALQSATDAELAHQATTPGVTLGIDMPGCTWMSAAGVADRSTSAALDATSAMRIASITKTFTLAVVLQLIEEGRLHFDDPMTTWVAFPGGGAITVRHLLAHTSGLYDYYNSPPVLASLGTPWTHEQVIDVARAQPLAFAAGTMQRYSNTNYYVLGMIIEAVTGHPYEVEVRTRLLDPLGLNGTYVAGVEAARGHLARGYDHTSGTPVDVTDVVHPSLTWAAGGIVSTTPDLLVWTRALMVGDVLTPTMRTAMLTPEPLTGGGTGSIGLGVQTQMLPGALGTFDSHLGRLQGYYGMIGYLPSHDAVTVQLTNDQDGAPNPFMTDMWMVVGIL